jgi:hypothetical protein
VVRGERLTRVVSAMAHRLGNLRGQLLARTLPVAGAAARRGSRR